MALTPGTRLGPYEVLSPLGKGGMGEVYKAQDTRLDRAVAIKVLPEHLAENPERRARFEREAKAISQLNHPHICTLYDVGEQDGVDFLVMEYIEGETLGERLARGALKLDQALEYGIEIAVGLGVAHRAGIVHRDLKPGNVMLTSSGVKLLDFGLARIVEEQVGPESDAPTQHRDLTQEEAIIGTLQYMAPEQLEAQPADARTDVFAFGTLLYEMVSGRKAFEGKSQASLISAIMTAEPPPISSLKTLTPPLLDHLVERCLAKEPDERWQSVADVGRELAWIRNGGGGTTVVAGERRGGELVKGLVAGVAVTALLAAALWSFVGSGSDSPTRIVRSTIELPPDLELERTDPIALSPDGALLAFAARNRDGVHHLYLRRLDAYESVRVTGTEGARGPFFSPDGNWVGFRNGGRELRKVAVGGGAVETIADRVGPGATWTADGESIVFPPRSAGAERGLVRISSEGGEPTVLTELDAASAEYAHSYPAPLPNAIAFRPWSDGASPIKIVSLGTGDVVAVATGDYLGAAQYSPTGHLIYGSSTLEDRVSYELVALPFDALRLEPLGPPRTVLQGVRGGGGQTKPHFTIAQNGTLAYVPAGTSSRAVVWVDRDARETVLWEQRGEVRGPRLSPSGRSVALRGAGEVWVADVDRGTRTKIDTEGTSTRPVWTSDSQSLTFGSNRDGSWDIYEIPVDGSRGAVPLVTDRDNSLFPRSWSPDGSVLTFEKGSGTYDIWLFPRGGDVVPFVETPSSDAREPRFSPDGRFVAYQSDVTGREEIYVKPYPGPGGAIPVSTDGGTSPVWSPDGRELFYMRGDELVAIAVSTSASLEIGEPRVLFEAPYELHDISLDGKQFLMIKTDASPRTRIHIVQNWFQELERVAPAGGTAE